MTKITPGLIVAALLAVLSMSLVPILIRSTSANEVTIGIVRLAIAMAILSPVILFRQRSGERGLRELSAGDWLRLLLVGLLFGIHWLLYFISIKWASASIAAVAVSTYGIHLLILNRFVKNHVVRLTDGLAVAACFAGCVLIAPDLDLQNRVTLGLLVGIASGFFYACLPFMHQSLMHVPTGTRAWGQFAFACLVFVPLFPLSDWTLTPGDWWRLLVLGVVCTVIGHTLWVKASSELPAVLTSVTYYLYVPIAMVSSFFLLNEQLTASMVLGAVLILGANITTALLTWQRSSAVTKRDSVR